MLSLNKPCICGSKKQYKRCCINKPNIKNPIINKIKRKTIKSISDVIEVVDYPTKLFKMNKRKIVYLDGVFDLFHRGHLESIIKAKNPSLRKYCQTDSGSL